MTGFLSSSSLKFGVGGSLSNYVSSKQFCLCLSSVCVPIPTKSPPYAKNIRFCLFLGFFINNSLFLPRSPTVHGTEMYLSNQSLLINPFYLTYLLSTRYLVPDTYYLIPIT